MDNIFVSIIFEFTGAVLKWLFTLIYSFLKGEKPASFSRIWDGNENDEHHDKILMGFSNVLIGFAFFGIILATWIFLISI